MNAEEYKSRLHKEMRYCLMNWREDILSFNYPSLEEISLTLHKKMKLEIIEKQLGDRRSSEHICSSNRQGLLYFNKSLTKTLFEIFPSGRILFAVDTDDTILYGRDAKEDEVAFPIRVTAVTPKGNPSTAAVTAAKIFLRMGYKFREKKYIFSLIPKEINGEKWILFNNVGIVPLNGYRGLDAIAP